MNRELIRDHGNAIVGNALGNPMMARGDFHIPCFQMVGEQHAVAFSGAILGHDFAQTFHTFARCFHIGQHSGKHGIFGKAIFHIGVECQNAIVCKRAFGGRHCNMGGIHASLFEKPLFGRNVGHSGITKAPFGQRNGKPVRPRYKLGAIAFARRHHAKRFRRGGRGVVFVAGNKNRAVARCGAAYENRCARTAHKAIEPFFRHTVSSSTKAFTHVRAEAFSPAPYSS